MLLASLFEMTALIACLEKAGSYVDGCSRSDEAHQESEYIAAELKICSDGTDRYEWYTNRKVLQELTRLVKPRLKQF